MSGATVKTQQADSVLRITLNRPEKRNALSQELVADLIDVFDQARQSTEIRVIVITGEGAAFSAGADLDALRKLQSASRADNERDSALLADLFRSIYTHPKIVIARVNGHAIAGGCGLVAAADFAIAVESSKLGFTEVRIGFVPAIVSIILERRLAGADVRRLLLTGELVAATEAQRIGLVTLAVSREALDDAVASLASKVASETSPEAVALTKRLMADAPRTSFEEALKFATEVNVAARSTEDCKAGIAAFLDKVDPPWKRRGR